MTDNLKWSIQRERWKGINVYVLGKGHETAELQVGEQTSEAAPIGGYSWLNTATSNTGETWSLSVGGQEVASGEIPQGTFSKSSD